ncbi:ATP-binding protein [Rubrobacter naiadicus]|uniref:ATP-binding protein n=1 Tax=Rubrobacter naiadicus TaxID=1392641 RepID=UPI0023610BC3|nr:ATP-binding protein [Rubrobacter naiadicus]
MRNEELAGLVVRARGLALFRGVLGTRPARDLLSLLGLLARERPDAGEVAGVVGGLWAGLAASRDPLLPDAWQAHFLGSILDDENPFSLGAETGELPPALLGQARRELPVLQGLFGLGTRSLLALVEERLPELGGLWEPLVYPGAGGDVSPRQEIARKLAAAPDWGGCAELLAGHFARQGAGTLGRYRAFRWREGGLVPVESPDPVRLEDLVAYEEERRPLIENTERLLAGLPSHHALLYGPPGTGKSSTVKALANAYAADGLRLVELPKEDLGRLPELMQTLRRRGARFIVFVDDLSFEEDEVSYKTLKALLEGSVAPPPQSVRLYATSNRRNLVRERFSDREEDDVHVHDTMQEKLSLAARFGLRVTFPPPDQKRYLEIVFGLARARGLAMPEEELRERALLWERWHPGRSGRTARQFVDGLEAGLKER